MTMTYTDVTTGRDDSGLRERPRATSSAGNAHLAAPSPRLTLRPGVYRHFKGKNYEVLGVAPLVDSADVYVVYRPLYGDRALVLRRYDEFAGTVFRDGREQPRFQFVPPSWLRSWWERLFHLVGGDRLGRVAGEKVGPNAGNQQRSGDGPHPMV